jgi:tRNA(Ile)-lysidine synthase
MANSRSIADNFAKAWPAESWRGERLLLAISGGADSVALLRLLLTSGVPATQIVLAHLDHQLRADSADDAQFVQQLAHQQGCHVIIGQRSAHALAASQGDGIEAAARQVRYDWLTEIAQANALRYVLTAHTQADQVETILHRLLRGTGLTGLVGMRPFRELTYGITLARPLLHFDRQELRDWLTAINQPWREDPSNQSREFTRNRIRLDLLPALRADFNPNIDQSLLQLSQQAAELLAELQPAIAVAVQRYTRRVAGADAIAVECVAVEQCSDLLLSEVLRSIWHAQGWPSGQMTAGHWHDLVAWCRPETKTTTSQRTDFPGCIRVKKTADGVELHRLSKD